MEGKLIARVGVALTLVYLIGMGIYVYEEWPALNKMSPNEFGDFLAGTVGPLAFLWLVGGFYLQREGLSQNSAALRLQTEELALQVKELRNSVEQQSRMATVAELSLSAQSESAEREKLARQAAASPRFIAAPVLDGETLKLSYFSVRNTGAEVTLTGLGGAGHEKVFISPRLEGNIWSPTVGRNVKFRSSDEPVDQYSVIIEFLRSDNLLQTATIFWKDVSDLAAEGAMMELSKLD